MEPLLPCAIALPERGSRRLLRDLHQQLRSAITDGRLQSGFRLPSTRSLAERFRISRNTVVLTYDLLLSEGYLVARRGSGTCVADTLPWASKRGPTSRSGGTGRQLNAFWRARSAARTAADPAIPPYSFRLGIPEPGSFPVEAWQRASNRVLRAFRSTAHVDTDVQGRLALREGIAQHVSFTRAVACTPEDIVVTAGARQAFELLARVLVTPRRTTVALEDPGYPPVRACFEAASAKVAAVPVDDEGLLVHRLPAQARIICVTPSHQFPLGCVLSARRRAALLEFARAHGAVVIEDDYDGEFRFEERPLDALQTLDRTESVFYVGTFSKSLMPALRLGYIVAPPWARSALIAAKSLADGPCCALTQDILSVLIEEGHLARHVRSMLRIYAGRREALLAILQRDFASWLQPVPSSAGLHVSAVTRLDADDRDLEKRALRAGVGVRALSHFAVRRGARRGVIFGYGAIGEASIVEGLGRLRRALV
jgi:GntR family transcriptional regulator / MocR family aminotransferase